MMTFSLFDKIGIFRLNRWMDILYLQGFGSLIKVKIVCGRGLRVLRLLRRLGERIELRLLKNLWASLFDFLLMNGMAGFIYVFL